MILKSPSFGFNENIALFAGSLAIRGVVEEQGRPLHCRVDLYEKKSRKLVFSHVSDDLGRYEFNALSSSFKYFVVTHHPTSTFNAVIQDNVVPK